MTTSHKTRQYWVEKAKGWAENFLTHPDYGGSPQLDEFNAVMDELLALSEVDDIEKMQAELTQARAIIAERGVRIVAQNVEIERLREALDKIANIPTLESSYAAKPIARQALEEK